LHFFSFVITFIICLFSKSLISVTYQSDIDLSNHQTVRWNVNHITKGDLTGEGIRIGILDSGIAYTHPDLSNLQPGYNAIFPNALPIDDYGHGTLVTGIIASQNNNIGTIGIAPKAEIYPVKVLDKYGEGDIDDITKGIYWCIDNKIQIINMSFALPNDNQVLHDAINKAMQSGIIIVASASNTFGGSSEYPASYDQVISVTAVDIFLRTQSLAFSMASQVGGYYPFGPEKHGSTPNYFWHYHPNPNPLNQSYYSHCFY
jgi:subtilisin family serine protease